MSNSQCFINCRHRKVDQFKSSLCLYRSNNCIVPPISCLHSRHREHCNVGPQQVQIMSISYPLYTVYIVNIVDIAMFGRHRFYIKFTSSLLYLVYIVDIVDIEMLIDMKSTSCLNRIFSLLFTTSTSSTSQCWSTLSRYRVYIVPFFILFNRWHCRCSNVYQHWVIILFASCIFFLVYIVDIAVLIDIKSTSCLHHTPYIFLNRRIVDFAMLTIFEWTLCLHCEPILLFTSSTLST